MDFVIHPPSALKDRGIFWTTKFLKNFFYFFLFFEPPIFPIIKIVMWTMGRTTPSCNPLYKLRDWGSPLWQSLSSPSQDPFYMLRKCFILDVVMRIKSITFVHEEKHGQLQPAKRYKSGNQSLYYVILINGCVLLLWHVIPQEP